MSMRLPWEGVPPRPEFCITILFRINKLLSYQIKLTTGLYTCSVITITHVAIYQIPFGVQRNHLIDSDDYFENISLLLTLKR